MADRNLRRGTLLLREGKTWRVNLLSDNTAHLACDETGEFDRLSVQEITQGCYEGRIEEVRLSETALTPEQRALLNTPIADQPDNVASSVIKKDFYIQAFENPVAFHERYAVDVPRDRWLIPHGMTRPVVEPFIDLVHQTFVRQVMPELRQRFTSFSKGYEQAPAFSTFHSWVAAWRAMPCRDRRLLASRFDLRGSHKRRMSAKLEDMLNDAIDSIWLNDRRNKKVAVYHKVKRDIIVFNRNAPDQKIAMIGQRQVSRYISETVDRETAVRRRHGAAEADREFKLVGKAPDAKHILDVVEIDHTTADVEVLDDATLIKLGRPIVTTALDRRSRLPVGIYVHFDSNSLTAVMTVLKDVMSPKGYLNELYPEIDYDYPACGIPETLFMDRGADFDSEHVRDVALTFDMRIQYEPVGCPEYKGKLERWHRTMQEDVAHPLPGAAPPRDKYGVRRDPQGKAYITLEDFKARLWYWVAMVYAKRPHRTLRDTPLNVWNRDAEGRLPRLPRPVHDLNMLLNRVEMCALTRNGIRWKHLRWQAPVIRDIMIHPAWQRGTKVKVRIDERDVSKAWVVHPYTKESHPLELVDPGYSGPVSLYQHRLHLMLLDENMHGARDPEAFLEAAEVVRQHAKDLSSINVARPRQMLGLARYLGGGNGEPGATNLDLPKDPPQAAPDTVFATDMDDEPLPTATAPVRKIRKSIDD